MGRYVKAGELEIHQPSTGDFLKFLGAFLVHETASRLEQIERAHACPGRRSGSDEPARTRRGRGPSHTGPPRWRRRPSAGAQATGAQFEVMPNESHQPFQESPDDWNARMHEFWQEAERLHSDTPRS